MLLILLLPAFSLSRSIEETFGFLKLRYSFLIVDDNEERWDQYQSEIDNITKNYEEICKSKSDKIPEEACKEVIQALDGTYFSNSDDIDKVIHQIPKNAEVVYLFNAVQYLGVNFNKLVDQKKVLIFDFDEIFGFESKKVSAKSKDLIVPKIFGTFLSNTKVKSTSSNDINKKLKINGNIKYRVSYLYIYHHEVDIDSFDLNIDTLVLHDSDIHKSNNAVSTTNLIVNPESHGYIIQNLQSIQSQNLIKVHQYGVFFDDVELPFEKSNETTGFNDVVDIDYRIVFQKDKWELLYKPHGNEDQDYIYEEGNFIPYSLCEVSNFIVHSLNFDLNVTDPEVENPKGINLTIMNLYDYVTPISLVLLEEDELSITTSGLWSDLKTKPKIVICKDKETKLKTDVEVEEHELYSYAPKPPVATPTVDPSPHFSFSKFSAIMIFNNYSICQETKSQFEEMFYNCPYLCNEGSDDYDRCMAKCNSFGELMCSNGKDINDKLKYISEDTDTLMILNTVDNLKPDFNNLKQQMMVIILNAPKEEFENEMFSAEKLIKIVENPFKKLNHYKKVKDDDDEDFQFPKININGNIKEKISLLLVFCGNLTITDEDLNVNTFYLYKSFINKESKKITATNFVIDEGTYEFSRGLMQEKIKVDQFGISLDNEDISNDPNEYDFDQIDLRVIFDNDKWSLQAKDHIDSEFPDDGIIPFQYELANKFNIISKCLNLDLHIKNENVQTIKPINFTLLNLSPIQIMESFLLEDVSLTITTSGHFNEKEIDDSIVTVTLPDGISYSAPQSLKVNKQQLYSYVPKVPTNKNPYTYPALSMICISQNDKNCSEKRDEFYLEKENSTNLCRQKEYYSQYNGGYKECLAYYQSFNEFLISNSEEINSKLSQIPENTDALVIMNFVDGITIDFNKLNSQMIVTLYSVSDNVLNSISINGDINDKVSYLTVLSSKLKISEHDLDINSLALIFSTLELETKVHTNELLVDSTSHEDILKNIEKITTNELIKVSQYGYLIPSGNLKRRRSTTLYNEIDDENFVNKDFRVTFENDRWLLLSKEHDKESENYSPYKDDDNHEFGYVPYSLCDSFNLMVKAFDFDFNVENADIKSIKPVNVTINTFTFIFEGSNKIFTPRDATVTSSGDWSGIENKPKMILSADENEVNLDQISTKDVDVDKEGLYVYVPKSLQPDSGETDEPTTSTSTSIITTDTSSSTDDSGDDSSSGGKKNNKMLLVIIGVVVGVVVIAVIIGVVIWYLKSKKNNNFRSSTAQSYNSSLLVDQ